MEGRGSRLTRPCQSPRCPFHSPHRGCGAPSVAGWAPGAAGRGGPRRTACGRCPCGPFRAGAVSGGGGRLGGRAYLIAGVHVDASPEAMIQTAVLQVVAVLGSHGQSGPRSAGQRSSKVARGGDGGWTHPFDAIVTIGTGGRRRAASRAGSVD